MNLLGENEKTKRRVARGELKGVKEMEAMSKYRQSIIKKKRKIEHLFHQSISNQIYIFPRGRSTATDSSQTGSDSLNRSDKGLSYDLKAQNQKNKNYQTSHVIVRSSSVASAEADRLNSKRKEVAESRPKKQGNGLKSEVNLSNYQSKSRKQRNEQKTATNSGKKLFYLPSGSQRGHVKKPSETIIVSFRGKQGEKSKSHKTELY